MFFRGLFVPVRLVCFRIIRAAALPGHKSKAPCYQNATEQDDDSDIEAAEFDGRTGQVFIGSDSLTDGASRCSKLVSTI